MATVSKRELMLAAAKARRRAVAPYSNFKVGAALLKVSLSYRQLEAEALRVADQVRR